MTRAQSFFQNIVNRQVSIAPLVTFRILFGLLLFLGTLRFLLKGWVETLYILPKFHFTYYGFSWIKPLPDSWMYLPFIVLLIFCLFLVFGFLYRITTAVLFLTFTYIELLDKTTYLNHYYFVSIVLFLLMFISAAKYYSVDNLIFSRKTQPLVAAWEINLLKFQIALVYIFAGLAKLNYDWLFKAQPLKIWLQANHNIPIVGSLLQQKETAFIFSWFGCIYDLFIVFFLLKSSTRPIAYLFVVVFHLITWLLFPIGLFPWIMICITTIYFSPIWHQKFLNRLKTIFKTDKNELSVFQEKPVKNKKLVYTLLSVFIFLQIAIPLRYLAYPGNLYWNEEGFRFSWRVMLMHKQGNATFYIEDKNRRIEIDNSDYLTEFQEDQMSTQADMQIQYAKYLQQQFSDTILKFNETEIHLKNPKVYADIFVTLNGRPSQRFINEKIDLSQQNYNLKHRNWVMPLNEMKTTE